MTSIALTHERDKDKDKGATTTSTTSSAGSKNKNPNTTVSINNLNMNSGGGGKKRSQNKATGGAQMQSLNHLLNFTLPPRQPQGLPPLPRRSRKTTATGTYNNWSKEKFVNAQYRFVMKPTGDYTVHFADPDIFFQWHDILQVIVPRTSALAAASVSEDQDQQEGLTMCPICLSPPSAPRMTKCGHVFCYPCVLHYLSTSQVPNSARCPICFDTINEKQLKSVRWFDEPTAQDETSFTEEPPEAGSSSSQIDTREGEFPKPGSMLRMRLMERPQITTLSLPRSNTWPSDLIPPHQAPFHFLPDVFRFARFMLATPAYLIEHLSKDLDELASERRILAGMKDELSVAFVDAADRGVRLQMEKAAALETDALKGALARAEQGLRDLERSRGRTEYKREIVEKQDSTNIDATTIASTDDNVPIHLLQTQGFDMHITQPSKPAAPPPSSSSSSIPRNQRGRRNVNPPPPSPSAYHFYQAASGAPIFLHPLDIRILVSHFGSYSSFPDVLEVRVEASAEGAVDGALRRRCKYLAHMPESAHVVFVEADWQWQSKSEDREWKGKVEKVVVGEETLKAFEAPLRARRTKRRERGRRDDRARMRAEEREREKMRLPPSWTLPQPDPVASNGTTGGRAGGGEVDYELLVSMAEEAAALEDGPALNAQTTSAPVPASTPVSTTSGAWGTRTFASAAARPSQPHTTNNTRGHQHHQRLSDNAMVDEWDVDAAWHELEAGRAASGGGRRKRANKMIVLGGAGAGAGRRR